MRSLKLGHQARANTDKGQEGSALARAIAVVALLAGAVLVVLTLFGNGDGYRYKMLFQTGGQLVPGNQVLVAGQPVGTIDSIELTDDAQAEVDVKLDRPLLEGTTAQIRLTSLSGIANRYIALHMGPDPDAELPDGATLAADNTTSPVDLDQLFNTFDERTRASLQDFIRGQATVYTGNSAAARRTYKYFAPSLQAGERLLADLNYDQQALSRFLVEGGRVFGAVAERRDDLAALTQNGNEALGAIASENEAFDQALGALPPTMRQANTTFVNLRAALDDLDPLIGDLGEVAPDLPQFLRDVRPVARDAVPVIRNLRLAIRRHGDKNDLTNALRDLPAAQRAARKAQGPTIAGLNDSQHIFEFARPYSPDLIALISKLGPGAGGYDFNGHYLRGQATGSNLFDWDALTEDLDPIGLSQIFDAYPALGLGPFTRCPGGATQANAGWPAPEDHPFLADGELTGECDPSEVPPGP
jgi:phospholipid/cholesterol/gamma-HCH transport system substrate-binding protein